MDKHRKMYEKEFKLNAIRFYEESGKRLRDVEKELGIGSGCLSHWRKELRDDKGEVFRGNGKITEEQKKVYQLERENKILREECEILKKVVGMFSKPSR